MLLRCQAEYLHLMLKGEYFPPCRDRCRNTWCSCRRRRCRAPCPAGPPTWPQWRRGGAAGSAKKWWCKKVIYLFIVIDVNTEGGEGLTKRKIHGRLHVPVGVNTSGKVADVIYGCSTLQRFWPSEKCWHVSRGVVLSETSKQRGKQLNCLRRITGILFQSTFAQVLKRGWMEHNICQSEQKLTTSIAQTAYKNRCLTQKNMAYSSPISYVQRSPLFCANISKKDPGRVRQNSLATAGTNFTKPGAHNKGDLCRLPTYRYQIFTFSKSN